MYNIYITYDTGDSFNQQLNVIDVIEEIKWTSKAKAKEALKEIEEHYNIYMMLHNECNAGKEDKEKAQTNMENAEWYGKKDHRIMMKLKGDDGKRVKVITFWCGYFESLISADIEGEEDGMSINFRKY